MLSKAPRSVWYSNHRRVFYTSSKCNYSSALPRLIQQHDLWITQEGTADRHTLLLSTRQSTTTRSDTRLQTLVAIPKFGTETANTRECTSPDWLFQKKSVEVFLVFQILKCIRLLGNDITSWTMEFPPQLPERAVCWRQEFNEQMQNLVEFVARKVGKFSGSWNHTMSFDGDETSRNFPRKRASKCIMHVRL